MKMQERRCKKFMLALTPSEREALDQLAQHERLAAAAVVRRLVWHEAQRHGLAPSADGAQHLQREKPDA
jgi:hypothetical protein